MTSNYFSLQGELIFEQLIDAVRERNISLQMVENYPPKDRGDNEDGRSLLNMGWSGLGSGLLKAWARGLGYVGLGLGLGL